MCRSEQSLRPADEMLEAWQQESHSATGRATTANICRVKSRAMQDDFIRAGCEVAPTTTITTTTTTTAPTSTATPTKSSKPRVPGLG